MHHLNFRKSPFHILFLLAVGILLTSCDSGDNPPAGDLTPSGNQAARTAGSGSYDALFDEASAEFGVPADLLKAIAHAETEFHMAEGVEEFEDRSAAYGLMALRGDRLERGTQLAGLSVKDVQTNPRDNIRAAAALLSEEAQKLGIDESSSLGSWATAVAEFSGLEDDEAQAYYVHNEIYDVLNEGIVAESNGQVVASIMPTKVTADFPRPQAPAQNLSTDYGPAIWRGPSPNQSARPSGSIGNVHMVVIHTCQGNYSGCWSWLNNPNAGASAHYVVSRGTEITQLVREYRRAWHIAASYDCNKNRGHDCWRNGYSSNHFTIGIEHAGFVSQSYPSSQINASAKLTCDITQDHSIPRNRSHIWGHEEMQPWNRSDPGPNWPWSTYMNKVRAECGGGGGGGTIIVDSNNNNNGSNAEVIPASGWSVGSFGNYYGTGYYWHSAEASSNPVRFRFNLSSAGSRTVSAWWSDGSNRTPSAPFLMYNSNGTHLGTVHKDQRTGGGGWRTLGTFNFTAGWNEVRVSHWTSSGVVIADAVRIN